MLSSLPQSNQDTSLSNPFLMGNSRKYPYHTMDCFHILNSPAFRSSKMGYPQAPKHFRISSHSQSHESEKIKMASSVKKNMFCIEWTNNLRATAVFTIFCSIMASGARCTALHFVGFLLQMDTNVCLIDWSLSYLASSVISSVISSCFICELMKSMK